VRDHMIDHYMRGRHQLARYPFYKRWTWQQALVWVIFQGLPSPVHFLGCPLFIP